MLENENMIDLLGSLKEMSFEQLSCLIQEETGKESPNDELVLMALDILEDREKEKPVQLGPKETAAWKKYQSKIRARQQKRILIWKPVMQVASVVLVITMLFALLPTQANAETWWERLARWTDDFFSFFNPNESEIPEDEYVFQTDNEGLQQVYDAVVELGVSVPVVPMWLPDAYELKELTIMNSPALTYLMAVFSNDSKEMIYQFNIYSSIESNSNEYHKDETEIETIERYGTTFNIMQNNDKWVAVWIEKDIECSIVVDCQKDILYEIIESIYKWRGYIENNN